MIAANDIMQIYIADMRNIWVEVDMSLERLYYHDPFSNIIISCDLYCSERAATITQALRTTIASFELLSVAMFLDEDGHLKYRKVGHKRNSENILFVELDEQGIVKSLVKNRFDLQNAETLKIMIQAKEYGYTMFFCMHHIIGDANSLILLIKKFFAVLQHHSFAFVEAKSTLPKEAVEVQQQIKYFIDTINKQYPRQQYTRNDYQSMHLQLYRDNELDITKITLNKYEYLMLKEVCKALRVSITAYLVSKIFEKQHVDTICLPMDFREAEHIFGNFVSRIDISRRSMEKETDKWKQKKAIDRCIKKAIYNKVEREQKEEILRQIHPGFFDDVIYDLYANVANSFARKMTRLIGYKENGPTTYFSNLKYIEIPCTANSALCNLCFYPPHPLERFSTIGVVTQNEQMTFTIQKFRKEALG